MKQLNGLSVLVTGATGYLGSRVCEILATSEKARVKGIGRNLDRVAFLKDAGVELISADIQNESEMRSFLVDVDVVIHCAVVFNVDPETAQKINVDATLSSKELKSVPILVVKLLAFANKIPGVKTPIDSGFIEMATSRKVFPTTKAKEKIGWEPKVTYEEGMKRTLEWLKREFM